MTLLSVNNLTREFGGLTAVSDFCMRFDGPELVGLIGPNGAGKTTVFNLISGFYVPTRGEILFKGKPIGGQKPHRITSRGIARTFQNIRLWNDMTVLDNILVSHHSSLGYGIWAALARTRRYAACERKIRNRAIEILEAMDLARLAGDKPRNLPYGIQRKVEIARALSIRPHLLLLDEPAAGLNSSDIVELIALIRRIYDEFKIAIWMIEHQMAVVMSLCSRIQVIDFGKTIAEGTPAEIQNHPEVIRAYLGVEKI
jgi:branched-chain amino acid transport system ATP-binding protein